MTMPNWMPLISASTLVLLTLASPASAGQKSEADVSINYATRTASGAIGTARSSAGTNQNIGCQSVLSITPGVSSETYLVCSAANANGDSVFCIAPVTFFHDVAATIADDSYIKFTWNDNGDCSSIEVRNYSYYKPRQP
jgi:hypothetical protein